MQASEEQQGIIDSKNNTIVVSNPGTGKTTTLSLKVVKLLKDGVKPESILCITFTDKAKKAMFDAIYDAGRDIFSDEVIMKINIHTFHSFAYNYLVDAGLIRDNILENNFLRFSILTSLEKNHTTTYGKDYLISQIIPKTENAIRYIKSFGLTPNKIDATKARSILGEIHDESSTYLLDEMNVFLDHFILAYREYEESKGNSVDYTDVLLTFIEKFRGDRFEYVLVDEVQDMNEIEADIVRLVAKNMFLVGDAKQAIFGFQGGSVKNFENFQDTCERKLLTTNRRSSQQILDYSKEYFLGKTGSPDVVKKELEALTSKKTGISPKIISTDATLSRILNIITANPDKKIGVITRKNSQIIEISKFLDVNGVTYSSTSSQAIGQQAKYEIQHFIRGLLSPNLEDKVLAAFTAFSPYTLQEAFAFSDSLKKNNAGLASIKSWGIKMHRADLDTIYRKTILPICVSKGFEWFATALSVKNEIDQYMALGTPTLDGLLDFIVIGEESYIEMESKSNVTLTTIHKAKGREFDVVVYVPGTSTKSSFVDEITQSILLASGIDIRMELAEEPLRLDFVAFTRAKEQLIIVARNTDAKRYHLQGISEFEVDDSTDAKVPIQTDHRLAEAYSAFVAGRHFESKQILEVEDDWIGRLIRDYFKNIEKLSYSVIKTKPYEFLKYNIIKMPFRNSGMEFGTKVHTAIQQILTDTADISKYTGDVKKSVQNILDALSNLKDTYDGIRVDSVESHIEVPLNLMTEGDNKIRFTGKLDTVFKYGDRYMIVDYKTDKRVNSKSQHRKQLAAYKRMLSVSKNIPEKNIDACIVFSALRGGINTGKMGLKVDQSTADVYPKFEKDLKKILEWKKDPQVFIDELLEVDSNEALYLAVREKLVKFNGSDV